MARRPKFDKEALLAALEANANDLTRTAVALDVSPSTVFRAMKRHGIEIEIERRAVVAS